MNKKNLLITYTIEFVVSLICLITFLNIICSINYDLQISTIKYRTIAVFIVNIALILIVACIYVIFKHNKTEFHKLFVALMIPIGLAYLIFLMPGQVADEDTHSHRAYEISTGKFISDANEKSVPISNIPVDFIITSRNYMTSYAKLIEEASKRNTDYGETIEILSLTQSYSPIVYICSSLAFLLARIMNLNFIFALYLARIVNFVIFLILGYYSIKLIPFGKVVLMTYLFIPMVIHQAISISADSITNSIIIFFIAFVFFLFFKNESINKKDKIMCCVLSILVSLTKIVYVPMVFILLMLLFKGEGNNTNDNSNKNKKQNLFIWLGIIIALIIAVTWFLFISNFRDGRENVYDEKSWVSKTILTMKSPVEYIKILGNTIDKMGITYTKQFIGSQLGWLDININESVILIYLFILLISPFLEKHKFDLTTKQKLLLILIFMISLFCTFIAMYAGWTQNNQGIISGIQGRYFIPIVILLLLCACYKDKYVEFKNFKKFYFLAISGINIVVIYQIAYNFIK